MARRRHRPTTHTASAEVAEPQDAINQHESTKELAWTRPGFFPACFSFFLLCMVVHHVLGPASSRSTALKPLTQRGAVTNVHCASLDDSPFRLIVTETSTITVTGTMLQTPPPYPRALPPACSQTCGGATVHKQPYCSRREFKAITDKLHANVQKQRKLLAHADEMSHILHDGDLMSWSDRRKRHDALVDDLRWTVKNFLQEQRDLPLQPDITRAWQCYTCVPSKLVMAVPHDMLMLLESKRSPQHCQPQLFQREDEKRVQISGETIEEFGRLLVELDGSLGPAMFDPDHEFVDPSYLDSKEEPSEDNHRYWVLKSKIYNCARDNGLFAPVPSDAPRCQALFERFERIRIAFTVEQGRTDRQHLYHLMEALKTVEDDPAASSQYDSGTLTQLSKSWKMLRALQELMDEAEQLLRPP